MESVRRDRDRASILERLASLTPDDRPRWGVLDAPRMICHVSDALRVALGDVPAKDRTTFVRRVILKPLVLRKIITPPRGRTPTAPEMLSSRLGDFEADRAALRALIERVATATDDDVARHPMFGTMTAAEWGRLHFLHLDHHLRQFGA